jgi:hypothetical protein
MRRTAGYLCMFAALTFLAAPASAERVMGEIIRVSGDTIAAAFPVPILDRSMMLVLAGEGESIAGLAMSRQCSGDQPPYEVVGNLYLTMDAARISAGKRVYVNSLNTLPAPSSASQPAPGLAAPSAVRGPDGPNQDLGLYYFASGQLASYGAIGLGYERMLRVSRSIAIELDGGITTVGNVNDSDGDVVSADQLIKSLNGRLRLDLAHWFGVYAGYRWNQGKANNQRWDEMIAGLDTINFVAQSDLEPGIVRTQGIEYGFALRPALDLALLAGYIPRYRAEFGSVGVLSEPAYTGELRLGFAHSMLRVRGLWSNDYWLADVGVTIR